jgi:dCMP deaminase
VPAVAYIPVLHEGYKRFITNFGQDRLYLVGTEFTGKFKPILKDIRALNAEEIAFAVRALGWTSDVRVLTPAEARKLSAEHANLVLANEDITRDIAKLYLQGCNITFADVFLRWDRHKTVGEFNVSPDRKISTAQADRELISRALDEAGRSADWWRHVGSLLTSGGEVVIATANQPVPSQHTPYANGDPRNNFSQGVHLELSTVLHSEARVIAEAARRGFAVEGMSMYVTTFPCPPCAKLIAYSGIRRLYYAAGYGVLDGESILRSQDVELILVDM